MNLVREFTIDGFLWVNVDNDHVLATRQLVEPEAQNRAQGHSIVAQF